MKSDCSVLIEVQGFKGLMQTKESNFFKTKTIRKEFEMRRTSLFIVTFIFFSFLQVGAQPGKANRPMQRSIEQRVDLLAKRLNLSEEQKKNVRKILEEHEKKMKKVFEENRGNRRAVQAANDELREQTRTQIMNLLDEKQKEAYKAYLKERQDQAKRGRQRSPQRPARRR